MTDTSTYLAHAWAARRELATVGALAAMSGVESQLLSHILISTNVGLSAAQLRSVADELSQSGLTDAASRLRTALDKHTADTGGR